MCDSPLERRRPEEIAAAIERAAAYAREQDVPLTAERLAAELEMRLDTLHAIARGEYLPAVDKAHPSAGARRAAKNAQAIRRACGEATASVVEHAMRRGSGTNMHLLYLKNNAGYDSREKEPEKEKADKGGGRPPVIFAGEEDIPE